MNISSRTRWNTAGHSFEKRYPGPLEGFITMRVNGPDRISRDVARLTIVAGETRNAGTGGRV